MGSHNLPSDYTLYFLLGQSLIQTGEVEKAFSCFNRASNGISQFVKKIILFLLFLFFTFPPYTHNPFFLKQINFLFTSVFCIVYSAHFDLSVPGKSYPLPLAHWLHTRNRTICLTLTYTSIIGVYLLSAE